MPGACVKEFLNGRLFQEIYHTKLQIVQQHFALLYPEVTQQVLGWLASLGSLPGTLSRPILLRVWPEQNGVWYGIPCSPPAVITLCVLRCSVPHRGGLYHLGMCFKSWLQSEQLSVVDTGPRIWLAFWLQVLKEQSLQLSWDWLRVGGCWDSRWCPWIPVYKYIR